jgi:hypothetical protein
MLEVENQGLRLDQPADVPVLTLFNQVHEIENNRGVRNYLKLLCVDRRNGKLLYERESKDGRPNLCDVQVDVEKWQVEVRSYIGCVKVTFAEQKTD